MVAALAALYFFVLAFPPTRHFFSLSAPSFGVILLSVIGAALAITFLVLTDDRFIPPLAFEPAARAHPDPAGTADSDPS